MGQLAHLYATMAHVNKAADESRTAQEFLEAACRILVEQAGFRMAWAGLVDEAAGTVRAAAHAGTEAGYLSNIRIALATSDRQSRGPTGRAVRGGRRVVCQDIASDPRMEPWRAAALERGYRSSAAIPLHRDGELLGVLSVYAARPRYFVPSRIAVLDELASDVAHGLVAFAERDRRRLAEQLLHDSEQRFRTTVETLLDPLVVLRPVRDVSGAIVDFVYEYANAAACAANRLPYEDLIGRRLLELFPAHASSGYFAAYAEVVETGVPLVLDGAAYADRWGGETMERVFDTRACKLGDGLGCTWRDVTERESAHRERERLAAVLEQSAEGVLVTDEAGILQYVNRAFLEAQGLRLADVQGTPAADLAARLLGAEAFAEIQEAAATGVPWLGELVSRGPAGMPRHVQLSMTPMRSGAGSVGGFALVSRDVTILREAEEERAQEAAARALMAETLQRVPLEATLGEAARLICDALVSLPWLRLAEIEAFVGEEVETVALAAPPAYAVRPGDRLSAASARYIRARAAEGPWAARVADLPAEDAGRARLLAAGFTALAYGPITHGDHADGGLLVATQDEAFARTLIEQMPAVLSFSTTSSALLSERIHRYGRDAERRATVEHVLAARSFAPVFQPIVDLATRQIVGHEALTRFKSGRRPDLMFADAWAAGLGPELERAAIESAVEAARTLPVNRSLHLNVAPLLFDDLARLAAIIARADRPVVLEITEHAMVADYAALREARQILGPSVRLAVDDAGAGVANFGHIVELRPDLVKLDLGLVRGVDADAGRQALVVAMQHFARATGCRLVAEGVETEVEARTLLELGVEFGQGYFFGPPAPAT